MNTYNSINPTEMSKLEIAHMIIELTTAKNWNQKTAEVKLPSGKREVIPVERIAEYQAAHNPVTGGINSNFN